MEQPEADVHAALAVEDDETLQVVVGELFPQLFGFALTPVDGGALAAETDLGVLYVGVLSDFVISLEFRLEGEYRITSELLEYLNEENAGSAFLTFSALDGHVWISANVDGRPLVPAHLGRVVTYLFQAAPALLAEISPESGSVSED